MANSNKTASKKVEGRFLDAALLFFGRNILARQIRQTHEDIGFREARDIAYGTPDVTFANAAQHVGLLEGMKTKGPFIDFINNLDPAKIAQWIQLILTLIGMFKGSPTELKAALAEIGGEADGDA